MLVNSPFRLQVTAGSGTDIVMIRSFRAPRRLVFKALTTQELLLRWFGGPPGWRLTVCEVDARVGGSYRYEWTHDKGRKMAMAGVFREVAPPERLVQTEKFDDPWYPGEAYVTTVLTEEDGVTTLTGTVTYETREIRDEVLRSPMESGVAIAYDRLEGLLNELAA